KIITDAGKFKHSFAPRLTKCLSSLEHHGDLKKELSKWPDYINRIKFFAEHSRHYGSNCHYQILNLTNSSIDLAITPSDSYKKLLGQTKYSSIGKSLCYYKKQ